MDRLVIAGLMNGALATLLALAAVAATRAWRNPYFGRIAWLAVLLKLVTPPLLFVPVEVAWFERVQEPVPAAAINFADHPAVSAPELPAVAVCVDGHAAIGLLQENVAPPAIKIADEQVTVARSLKDLVFQFQSLDPLRTLGAVWIAGSVLLGVLATMRIWRFQRLLSRSLIASTAVEERAAAIAARLSLRQTPRIRVVAGRMAPLAWSLGRQATVIIPAALVESLDEKALDAVLAHELTHLRRRDNWARWLELAATTAYWWCPTAWLARRRIHAAEEECCDADVLRMFPALRRAYGRALLETLDLLAGDRLIAPGASGWGTRRSLRRRFERLAAQQTAAPLRAWGRASCWTAIALLCLLAPTAASSEQPEIEPADATASSEPTSSQDENNATTTPLIIEDESTPCTITLKDGSIINGLLIDQGEERLVVLRDKNPTDEATTPIRQDPTLPQEIPESFKMWDLSLNECVRLSFENRPGYRIRTPFDADDRLTLSQSGENRQSLIDFQRGGEELVRDIAECYGELHFAYRDLAIRCDAEKASLELWRRVKAKFDVGVEGGSAAEEAQCRSQYYHCRQQVESAQSNLFAVENRLRYLMGLSASDGRLIRPNAPLESNKRHIDWQAIRKEALARRVEVREQMKRVEEHQRLQANAEAEAAVVETENPTLAQRIVTTKARHYQLLAQREAAVLKDIQLSISRQLEHGVRELDLIYAATQTNNSRNNAANDEVVAVERLYEIGRATLDLLLQAHQRRAEAASVYQRSLTDYQRAAMRVEHRKGTLLESFGIAVAE